MRMMIADVGVAVRRMDREIDGGAIAVGQILREGARQLQPLLRGELMRQRDLELPRDTRVPSLLCRLRRIPERRAIPGPFRVQPSGKTISACTTPSAA